MIKASRILTFAATSLKGRPLITMSFSGGDGPLKDREDAAEKIYIKQHESFI